MRILFTILLLTIFASISRGEEHKTPRIIVMMEIDSIIIDTIPPVKNAPNTTYIDALKKAGYTVQTLTVNTRFSKDKELDSFLKKTKQPAVELNDSNRQKVDETIVVRPFIKTFLEGLTTLEYPTYVLICSKSNDPRIQSIVDGLNLEINNVAFKNFVQFVPNEFFTVFIESIKTRKIRAKSAFELRNKYNLGRFGKILPSDYVLLIDNIPDSQFVLSNREHDLNMKITPFNIKHPDNYNMDYDQIEIASILEKMKNFIKKP